MVDELRPESDMSRMRVQLDSGEHVIVAPTRSVILHLPDGGRFEMPLPPATGSGEGGTVERDWGRTAQAAWEAYKMGRKVIGMFWGDEGEGSMTEQTCEGKIVTGTDERGLPTVTVETKCTRRETSGGRPE